MRSSVFLAVLLTLTTLGTGCRDTRDANGDELASLQVVTDSFWGSQDAATDQGEASVGVLSGNYSLLMALSEATVEEVEGTDGDGMAMGLRPPGSGLQGGHFVDDTRQPWPDCITEVEGGVSYAECEYGFSGEDGSISFMLDGAYNWSDQAADADLTYDLSVGSSDLSWEWMFHWGMDFAWTDTTVDGSFDVDYSYGVSLGGSPSLGGAVFSLSGSVTDLTADESCTLGPVAGVVDWTSALREGFNRLKREHVTIEWQGCGEATITM